MTTPQPPIDWQTLRVGHRFRLSADEQCHTVKSIGTVRGIDWQILVETEHGHIFKFGWLNVGNVREVG